MEKGYRHEYKFLISAQSALLLKHRLPHIMKLDPHVADKGQYTIRSLYRSEEHTSELQSR